MLNELHPIILQIYTEAGNRQKSNITHKSDKTLFDVI